MSIIQNSFYSIPNKQEFRSLDLSINRWGFFLVIF